MLLGLNCGRPLERMQLPEHATSLSAKHDFDMQVSVFELKVFSILIDHSLIFNFYKQLLVFTVSCTVIKGLLRLMCPTMRCGGKVPHI